MNINRLYNAIHHSFSIFISIFKIQDKPSAILIEKLIIRNILVSTTVMLVIMLAGFRIFHNIMQEGLSLYVFYLISGFCILLGCLVSTLMVVKVIEDIKNTIAHVLSNTNGISENNYLMMDQRLNDLYLSNVQMQKEYFDNQKMISIAQTAQQVAHDIRSPLAALSVAIHDLNEVPEDRRILIRQAVQRIEDIANDLASKKVSTQTVDEDIKLNSSQLISGILDLIVSEKRMQYRELGGIRIDCNITDVSYGLFANVHENTFKRVFSNLINNAVEVLGETGHIQVNLLSRDSELLIQVIDNGKGIAEDVLPKLMQRGETHGKKDGKGLGLFHARETIESWGGRMQILSQVGKGTEIQIFLPKVAAPDWFLPELRISKSTRVIVIDDDSSIHQIWTGRFNAMTDGDNEILHFSAARTVLKYLQNHPNAFSGDVVVLCDLELREDALNGLQLMKQIRATDKAVLVTSRFEEQDVRDECRMLGIRLIPKNLAGFVPIIVDETALPDKHFSSVISTTPSPAVVETPAAEVILIDDQDMIHTTWRMMAKIKKINLSTFHTADDFVAQCGRFDRDCKIFIDSNLADGVKGEIVAKDIYAKGFQRIYLATGLDKSEFPIMPWITDIVGKQPAF